MLYSVLHLRGSKNLLKRTHNAIQIPATSCRRYFLHLQMNRRIVLPRSDANEVRLE